MKSKNSDYYLNFYVVQGKNEGCFKWPHHRKDGTQNHHSNGDNKAHSSLLTSGIYGVAFGCSYVQNDRDKLSGNFKRCLNFSAHLVYGHIMLPSLLDC